MDTTATEDPPVTEDPPTTPPVDKFTEMLETVKSVFWALVHGQSTEEVDKAAERFVTDVMGLSKPEEPADEGEESQPG